MPDKDVTNHEELSNVHLGKRFASEGSQTSFNAYLSGASSFNGESGPVYIAVLRDSTVVDAASGWMAVPAIPHDTDLMKNDSVSNYTMKVPIEVPIDDTLQHTIQVLRFPYPYCRTPEGGSRYSDRKTHVSNTIFLE